MPTIKRPTRKDEIKRYLRNGVPDEQIKALFKCTTVYLKELKIELRNENKK